MRLGPSNAKPEHTLSLTFTPALAAGSESKFDVATAKKTKIAAGSVHTSADAGGTTETWSMSAPESEKNKRATANTTVQP